MTVRGKPARHPRNPCSARDRWVFEVGPTRIAPRSRLRSAPSRRRSRASQDRERKARGLSERPKGESSAAPLPGREAQGTRSVNVGQVFGCPFFAYFSLGKQRQGFSLDRPQADPKGERAARVKGTRVRAAARCQNGLPRSGNEEYVPCPPPSLPPQAGGGTQKCFFKTACHTAATTPCPIPRTAVRARLRGAGIPAPAAHVDRARRRGSPPGRTGRCPPRRGPPARRSAPRHGPGWRRPAPPIPAA